VAIANRDGLNVNRDGIFTFQSRPEWRGVPNEQPMMRRHKRNPAAVNQCPCDNPRENFRASQSRKISASGDFMPCVANSLAAARKQVGACSTCLASQSPSRVSMVSAGAALCRASSAQAAWAWYADKHRHSNLVASTSAKGNNKRRVECESHFILPCGKFRKRLAQ